MLAPHARSPKILVYSWAHDDPVESRLLDLLQQLVARVVVVVPELDSSASGSMRDSSVVACVLLVSTRALRDQTFEHTVRSSVNELARRKEFRLFVYLSDMTRDELVRQAQTSPAAADLVDSVHVREGSGRENPDVLVCSVEQHIKLLPEIVDYLRYERWKHTALDLTPLLSYGFMALAAVAWARLAIRPEETIRSNLLPWILAIDGAVCYTSVLAACSFGSSLRAGSFFRWGMALWPLWIVNTIPSSKLAEDWRHLVVGFGIGILLDLIRRRWAQSRRERIGISRPKDDRSQEALVVPGRWHWQMLTTAPILGTETSVFISYSRASSWGSSTASALHEALRKLSVSSFLDTDGIAEGTSWRHKLQEAIGRATVFVSIQDSLTSTRYWPGAELHAAVRSQLYCGLPSIIILRDATLMNNARSGNGAALLDALLSQKGGVDHTLLRIIDFRPDTPRHLANGLSSFQTASVVNPALGSLLCLVLGRLKVVVAAVGTVGAGISVVASVVWLCCHFSRIDVAAWLNARGLGGPVTLLGAFWLGFVTRLVFATRFELGTIDARQVFRSHLLAELAIVWMLRMIVPTQAPLLMLLAAVIGGFGFLSASDFLSRSLPGSRLHRSPPV